MKALRRIRFVGRVLVTIAVLLASPLRPGGGSLTHADGPTAESGDLGAELNLAPDPGGTRPGPADPSSDADIVVPNIAAAPAEEAGATPPMVADEERMKTAIDRAVAARLARHPPFYVPATDFAPPKGLVLHATTHRDSRFPFALALNGFVQGRWLNLARGTTQWTDATGNTEPVVNENSFNLNRIYIQAAGYAGSERVLYNIALFGSTNPGLLVTVAPVGFVGYAVTENIKVGAGVTQVPGSREWLMSSQWPFGIDRSMVNTFIRPSYSPGLFSLGSVLDKTLFYQAGVWNGIDGGASGLLKNGTAMAWAGNLWWEPIGPFGLGYSDMEHHESPALRLGTSGVTARSPATILANTPGFYNPENTVVRLSDGTPLSPAQNPLYPYRAGFTGTAIQAQYMVIF